jgi:hypothetical protein
MDEEAFYLCFLPREVNILIHPTLTQGKPFLSGNVSITTNVAFKKKMGGGGG